MFVCKKCGGNNSEEIEKTPHLGLYCKDCGAWNGWIKHSTNTKTKEEYRNEYMNKEAATDPQIYYIKNLIRNTKLSKYKAIEIIKLLGGEV